MYALLIVRNRKMLRRLQEARLPLEMSDFHLLLSALAGEHDGSIDLAQLREQSPRLTEQQHWTRCLMLSQHLGIPEGAELHVAEAFANVLASQANPKAIPRSALFGAIRTAADRRKIEPAFLARYQERLWRHLSRSLTGTLTEGDFEAFRASRGDTSWLTPFLRSWPTEILTSPAWNRIESPVPGVPDLPLQDTWVDLTLKEIVAGDSMSLEEMKRSASHDLSFDREWAGFSLVEMLLGVRNLTVLIGLPGAGKSTLIKWLACHVIEAPECPFGIPAVISLRQYARAKEHEPGITLLEYFLRNRCSDPGIALKWRGILVGLLDPPEEQWDSVETVLWLLDGWDEVPPGMRDDVLADIRSLSMYPTIVTTRQSGGPMLLPASKFFEVTGLQHSAALELAYKWLMHTDRSAYYGGIVTALDAPDLRRMARSPFLLTLFCALYSTPRGEAKLPPNKRSEILAEVIRLVYEQHNMDPKQSVRFSNVDKQSIETFAFWLLAEVNDAPRYVFDGGDYEASGASAKVFEQLLIPSRLIAQPLANVRNYQFLHANFQEFLAAAFLLRNPQRLPGQGQFVINPAWKEMVRLLVESAGPDTAIAQQLWRQARKIAKSLDRFGILASRLAVLVASAGGRDGGKSLLGIDLRDHLWRIIEQYASQVPKPLLDAFLELDPQDLARRILDHRLRLGKNDIMISWLELFTVFDLEMLVSDHIEYKQLLGQPEVWVFCPAAPDLGISDQPKLQSKILRRFSLAVQKRDASTATEIFQSAIDGEDQETIEEMVDGLAEFAPSEAGAMLWDVIEMPAVSDVIRGQAVGHIARFGDRTSRQKLMRLLATCRADDPLILTIIGSLTDSGIQLDQREVTLIFEYIRESPSPEVRTAAAQLGTWTRSKLTAKVILEALEIESDEAARIAFFDRLSDLAEETSLPYLWDLREAVQGRSPAEQAAWANAVLTTHQMARRKTVLLPDERWLPNFQAIDEWARLTASSEGAPGLLLATVLRFPEFLGPNAESLLLAAIRNGELSDETRSTSLLSLARLDSQSAVDFAFDIASLKADGYSPAVVESACESLGQMRPALLALLNHPIADNTMAQIAFRHETLFTKSGVQTTSGGSLNNMSSPVSSGRKPISLPPVDIAVFIAPKEEWRHFEQFLSRRFQVTWVTDDHPTKTFTFHRCVIELPKIGTTVSIAVVCIGEMGQERAANAASAMLDYLTPSSIVVIGIAGAISDDLRLGDIVIPNEVWSYLANSAADDTESGQIDFKAAGNHFRPDANLLNQERQVGTRVPKSLQAWRRRCADRLSNAIKGKNSSALPLDDITRKHPLVFDGDQHLATGPSVVRSEVLAKWIASHDRKTVAVEMESASVLDAVETEITTRAALAIRGISDFGDSRKSMVEKTFKGAFRRISMLNAIDYLCLLIEAGVFDHRT